MTSNSICLEENKHINKKTEIKLKGNNLILQVTQTNLYVETILLDPKTKYIVNTNRIFFHQIKHIRFTSKFQRQVNQ